MQQQQQQHHLMRADENGIILIDRPKLDSGMYRLKVNVGLSNHPDLNKNVISNLIPI